ncbi:hypothetical protein MC885_009910, partial [Smutsia gigantea]
AVIVLQLVDSWITNCEETAQRSSSAASTGTRSSDLSPQDTNLTGTPGTNLLRISIQLQRSRSAHAQRLQAATDGDRRPRSTPGSAFRLLGARLRRVTELLPRLAWLPVFAANQTREGLR